MSDFGQIRRKGDKRTARFMLIAFAVLAAGGVAFLVWSNMDSRQRAIADSAAQVNADSIVGPPCAAGTPQGKLGRGDQWVSFPFNDVDYGRRIGHADCGVTGAGKGFASVCQFTSPAELKVVTEDGVAHYFDVGLGRPATTIVTGDSVRCLMAGNFKG